MTELRDEDNETLYVGNLDSKVTEEILYELFLQAGPIKSVTIPKDKSKKPRSFGFVCFKDEVSMPYAYYLFRELPLFGRPLKVQPRNKRYNIPSVYCVGVHSLEPKIGKNDESQESSVSDPPAQEQFTPYSPQQQHLNISGQNPNTSSPMDLVQAYWMPKYICNVNGPPAVDTNAMKNFKNMFENPPHQSTDLPLNFNDQFNNNGNTFSDSYDRSHNSGRFSNDIHSSPRLRDRLDFSNNGRNTHSPYNNRNSSPKYNSNNNHQGHSNSPHRDSFSRHNNSSHSNFNSPYNSNYPNSPHNRSFNNSPYNDRDSGYSRGKRDYYGNDRRDFRRSKESGDGGYHNRSYHNDRNQRY